MSEWNATIPFNPMPTPRPAFAHRKDMTITFYPNGYSEYLANIYKYLKDHNLYNDKFYKTVNAKYGVIAEVKFYLKAPKTQKTIKKITRTTAPDIDNLLKAILDGVFYSKYIKEKDSRVVGVRAIKLVEMKDPRTEIKLIGLDGLEDGV